MPEEPRWRPGYCLACFEELADPEDVLCPKCSPGRQEPVWHVVLAVVFVVGMLLLGWSYVMKAVLGS